MDRFLTRRRLAALIVAVALISVAAIYFFRPDNRPTAAPIAAQYEVARTDNVFYRPGASDPLHQGMEIFAPIDSPQPAPVAMVLHGGSWSGGHRRIVAVTKLCKWLAERGVVCAATGYRLVPRVSVEQQADDIAAATVWLRENAARFGGDPTRLFLVGHSAGGHLAALVALDEQYLATYDATPDTIAGVIAIAAVFDLRPKNAPTNPLSRRSVTDAFGDNPQRLASLSPITHVGPHAPPFLILRGQGDDLIPEDQAIAFREALMTYYPLIQYHHLPGYGHIDLFHDLTHPGDIAGKYCLAFIRQ